MCFFYGVMKMKKGNDFLGDFVFGGICGYIVGQAIWQLIFTYFLE
jgi:hypothetical protein